MADPAVGDKGRINSALLSLEAQRLRAVPVRGPFLLPVHRVRQRRGRPGRQAAGLAEGSVLLRVRMLLGAPWGHSPGEEPPLSAVGSGARRSGLPLSFQDGRVPRHAQPDAHHALRQRRRLRHGRALRPVGPREEVRGVQVLVKGRGRGDGAPSASLRPCFALAQSLLRGECGLRESPSAQSPGREGPWGCWSSELLGVRIRFCLFFLQLLGAWAWLWGREQLWGLERVSQCGSTPGIPWHRQPGPSWDNLCHPHICCPFSPQGRCHFLRQDPPAAEADG